MYSQRYLLASLSGLVLMGSLASFGGCSFQKKGVEAPIPPAQPAAVPQPATPPAPDAGNLPAAGGGGSTRSAGSAEGIMPGTAPTPEAAMGPATQPAAPVPPGTVPAEQQTGY